jgi:hypothetical protein
VTPQSVVDVLPAPSGAAAAQAARDLLVETAGLYPPGESRRVLADTVIRYRRALAVLLDAIADRS